MNKMLAIIGAVERSCTPGLLASVTHFARVASAPWPSDQCHLQTCTESEISNSHQTLSPSTRSDYLPAPPTSKCTSMHPPPFSSFAAQHCKHSLHQITSSHPHLHRCFHSHPPPHAANATPPAVPATTNSGALHSSARKRLPTSLTAIPGVPRILFADPWFAVENREHRKHRMQACLAFLRAAGPNAALTAQQIHEQVNATAAKRASGEPPLLTSLENTHKVLEHLRDKRLILGRSNPDADLARGHPDYPYLYTALPYQLMEKGPPAVVAKREADLRAKREARALRRLRRGKTPYAIYRQVARSSCFQHALAYEAVANAQEKLRL